MTNQTNTPGNQEINLSDVSKKVKGYFSRINDSFFDCILFIKKNIIAVILIVIVGAGYGFYQDNFEKKYETKVFLIPNFSSTDYLYQEIKNLNSKVHNKEFKEANGINESKKIVKLEVEPIIDIYQFIDDPAKEVDQNDRTYSLFKLMAENSDMKKMMKDEVTSRNFKMHLLTITTKGEASESKDIKPLLDYLNANAYYKTLQVEYVKNLESKTTINDSTIKQIDAILNDFSKVSDKNANLVLTDNASLDEVIKLKDKLVKEQGRNMIDKVNFSKVFNDSNTMLNGPSTDLLAGKMKLIMPIIFLLIFCAVMKFISYYKKQKAKRSILLLNN